VHPPLFASKKPFERESIGRNRESLGVKGKVNRHDPSFPIPQPSFLFYFSTLNNSLFSSHFCLIPLLYFHINFQIGLQVLNLATI
jgi:hypothetical protein